MTLKIAHISSVHRWNDTRIFLKMARCLAAAGHKVVWVVLEPELSETLVVEQDGVEIHRLAGDDISGRLKRATKGAARVTSYARQLKPDIMQAHDPELIPFLVFNRLRRIKVIFDAHENFVAQNEGRDWAKGWKRLPINLLARSLKLLADIGVNHIIAATPSIAATYPKRKTININNYPIIGELAASRQAAPLSARPKRGIYVGGMADIRGLEEVIQAIDLAKEVEGIDLVGPFQDAAFEARLRALPGWSKIRYHGICSRDEVARLLSKARFGIVTFHPLRNHIESQPNKLFEYLSAGLPVLHSDFSLWRSITMDAGVGVPVNPLDPTSISRGMAELVKLPDLDTVGKLANELVMNRFSWDSESLRYKKLIDQIGVNR